MEVTLEEASRLSGAARHVIAWNVLLGRIRARRTLGGPGILSGTWMIDLDGLERWMNSRGPKPPKIISL